MPEPTVTPLRPRHRQAVRDLCCATGYLGEPIDRVFADRELFADYLTAYYTDRESESGLVLEVDGVVVGYLLGCRHTLRQQMYAFYQNVSLATRALLRWPSYNVATRRFIGWIVSRAWREVPAMPRRVPHFHINVLPQYRSVASTRRLMEAHLRYLVKHGERGVCGQLVASGSRRSDRLLRAYGFEVLSRRPVSKFDHLRSEPVFICTVHRELGTEPELSRRG